MINGKKAVIDADKQRRNCDIVFTHIDGIFIFLLPFFLYIQESLRFTYNFNLEKKKIDKRYLGSTENN